jgi:hypothetical protein
MIRHLAGLLLSSVMLAACSSQDDRSTSSTEKVIESVGDRAPQTCGIPLKAGAVDRFIERLSAGLARNDPGFVRSNDLFDERASFYYDGYRHDRIAGAEEPYRGRILTMSDWEKILDRLRKGRLEDVGWRGCMLAHGKIWFQGDPQGELKLFIADLESDWPQD